MENLELDKAQTVNITSYNAKESPFVLLGVFYCLPSTLVTIITEDNSKGNSKHYSNGQPQFYVVVDAAYGCTK